MLQLFMSHGWPATLGSPATASAGLLKPWKPEVFALIIMSNYVTLYYSNYYLEKKANMTLQSLQLKVF